MARIQHETSNNRTGSVRSGSEDLQPSAQVEGTLTGEVGLRCQLTHRPQREDSKTTARHMGRGSPGTATLLVLPQSYLCSIPT